LGRDSSLFFRSLKIHYFVAGWARSGPHRSKACRFGLGQVAFGSVGLPASAPAVRFWAFSPFGRVRQPLFFAFGFSRFAGLRRLAGFPLNQRGFHWLVLAR